MDKTLGLMYLAEESSPDDIKLDNLKVIDKCGAVWAVFDACIHSFDVLNRNQRMYDGDNVWNRITTNERIQDGLRKKCWYGEMDHPGQNFTSMALTAERVQKIDMANRSHVITKPRRDRNLLIATIETCPGTDAGIGFARDMIRGLIPSFSCRSIASMKMRGNKPYVDVKKIVTYDWVIYQSHREAEQIGPAILKDGMADVKLESVGSTFTKYSKDVCIPFNEFVDFRNYVSEHDENTLVLMESAGYNPSDITGIDVDNNTLFIEKADHKLYVNTSLDTKKKVEEFLLSF